MIHSAYIIPTYIFWGQTMPNICPYVNLTLLLK